MRSISRLATFALIPTVVFGLSKLHATAHDYDFTASPRLAWAIAYCALLAVAVHAAGLPDLVRERSAVVTSAVAATAGAALALSVIQLAVSDALLPRFVVFTAALVLTPVFALCAALAGDGRHRVQARDRVIFVGSMADAAHLSLEVGIRAERPALMVGALTPEAACDGYPKQMSLCRVADETRATVLVLDRQAQSYQAIVDQAARLHESGRRVRTMIGFYDEWLAKLPVSELERVSLLFDIGELHRARYVRVKRILDVAVTGMALLLVLPLVPLVVVGNLAGNRGPLLFRQTRIGKGGRPFTIYKFRTMVPSATTEPSGASQWTARRDPRITRFGHVLRRTHLDELPQLYNIVRGDLSLVGPRPEQPHYVTELATKLPFYEVRHLVRPGLTGWAQVKYGYAGDENDALEKLQYEFYYLRNQSLRFDARVLARTVRSVVRGDGR